MTISVEFRLQLRASDRSWRLLGRVFAPQVAAPGELINIDGDPYMAIRRDWALAGNGADGNTAIFAYVFVVPAASAQNKELDLLSYVAKLPCARVARVGVECGKDGGRDGWCAICCAREYVEKRRRDGDV